MSICSSRQHSHQHHSESKLLQRSSMFFYNCIVKCREFVLSTAFTSGFSESIFRNVDVSVVSCQAMSISSLSTAFTYQATFTNVIMALRKFIEVLSIYLSEQHSRRHRFEFQLSRRPRACTELKVPSYLFMESNFV